MNKSFRLSHMERMVAGAMSPAAALVAGILAVSVLGYTYMANSIVELEERRDAIQTRVALLDASFTEVGAVAAEPCSPAYLEAIEKIVVSSSLIQDIVYHKDAVICSAVSVKPEKLYERVDGISREAMFLSSGGIEAQRDVRFHFAPNVGFTLFTRGPLTLLIRTNEYPLSMPAHRSATLSLLGIDRTMGRVSTLFGPETTITPQTATSRRRKFMPDALQTVSCIADGTYCLVIKTSYAGFLKDHAWPICFFLLLGAAVGRGFGQVLLIWRTKRRSIATQLRLAVKHQKLFVLYQPIVDGSSSTIVGAEALVRWTVGNGQSISPDVFVPVAESEKLITRMTCLIIQTVGHELADVLRRHPWFKVSINIVPSDLHTTMFHQAITDHLEDAGIQPSQIAFEITERQEMKMGDSTDIMQELRRKGYQFYVDDFGTGYSSISYLDDLPVDAIKIDRSFTSTIGTDIARARLVPPMLAMARELSIPVIVEGVETPAQIAFFRDNHAVKMQGWFFGKAMPAAQLISEVELIDAAKAA